MLLHIADDLGRAHAGRFVDCWMVRWMVSLGGRGLCREWNPTIPKQPSGDLEAMVGSCDALKILRQMSCRPPMDLLLEEKVGGQSRVKYFQSYCHMRR